MPRRTQDCDAVAIVREHLPAFLERIEGHAGSLPSFVRDEVEAFVGCGDFERGFLLAQCRRCSDSLRVPFSCKGRGFCPSCLGRRMAETSSLLVDHRLPAVAFRQWVLTFEGPMAVRLGYDAALAKLVCRRFAHRMMQCLLRQTQREHDLRSRRDLHPGVMLVVQRFRSDARLFWHVHALATDGCFENLGDAQVRFRAIGRLRCEHLGRVLAAVARDLAPHIDDHEVDPLDDALAVCVQLGLRGTGPRPAVAPTCTPAMLVSAFGMQLHAAVTVDGRDRRRLQRVCRYLLRPPFAHDAIEARPDGRVRIHFKAPTRTGATHADIDRDAFLARLCALVPPPGVHTVRYYGVLAGRHGLRSAIAPKADPIDVVPRQLVMFMPRGALELAATRGPRLVQQLHEPTPTRLAWAQLLARVFRIDITICARCRGPMRIAAAVIDPDDIAAHLHGDGARARGPPRPTPPGQTLLFPA